MKNWNGIFELLNIVKIYINRELLVYYFLIIVVNLSETFNIIRNNYYKLFI